LIWQQNDYKYFPLGYKDYNLAENAIDISDKDGDSWLLHGNSKMFQPDANFEIINSLFCYQMEGDARVYWFC
jgi:hypothetical protein